jgi:hypothetical protein
MLDPTDAACLVLMIFAATVAVLLKIAAARRGQAARRLHEVRGVDGQGACRSLAIYAISEADALKRARRIAPAYRGLTVIGYRA